VMESKAHVVVRRVEVVSGRRLLTAASQIHGGVERGVARSRPLIRAERNRPTQYGDDGGPV
jgi:hypothetical protein